MDAYRNADELGVMVVGMGSFGTRRAAAVRRARGLRLVAVADANFKLATHEAGCLVAEAVESLDEGLGRPDVDVVIVCTPHADHEEAVRRSLVAGKHVLCEKPLATDPADARELAILADEQGVRLATGFNHRFYRPVREALQLTSGGAIGRVESVRVTIGHRASAAFLSSWHVDRAVSGGGTLMDNGPHACDLVRQFLGEIVAAQGYVRDSLGLPWGVESEAFALFRDSDRGVGEVCSSWTQKAGYMTVEVRGSGGFLRVETAPWRLSGQLSDGARIDRKYPLARLQEAIHRRRFGCESSLVRELEAFVSDDPKIRQLGATGWDGCRATEMIDGVYAASATCSEVALRPLVVHTPSSRKALRRAGSRRS